MALPQICTKGTGGGLPIQPSQLSDVDGWWLDTGLPAEREMMRKAISVAFFSCYIMKGNYGMRANGSGSFRLAFGNQMPFALE
jgi:hypothetical protein